MEIQFIHREDHSDPLSATLGVLEFANIPFVPRRLYWITDFMMGTSRGNHAHKSLNQIMLMARGSLQLVLNHGEKRTIIEMHQKSDYILIPAGYWREMRNASRDATLLVIADAEYLEEDYIRNWGDYLNWFSKAHYAN